MSKNTLLSELINYISANSSGNVVIAAPSSGYALDVTGTGRFTGLINANSGLEVYSSTAGSGGSPNYSMLVRYNNQTQGYSYIYGGNELSATYATYLKFTVNQGYYANTPVDILTLKSVATGGVSLFDGKVTIGSTTADLPLTVWGSGGIGIYSTNSYASILTLNFNNSQNIGYLLADQNSFYIRTGVAKPIYVQANAANGVYLSVGATSWTGNSDIRLKNIISPINNALDKLSALNPIIFSWKSDSTNKENIGLIAQDVESVVPQVIDTNEDGFLGVRYVDLVPVLIKAIQELKAEIDLIKQQ